MYMCSGNDTHEDLLSDSKTDKDTSTAGAAMLDAEEGEETLSPAGAISCAQMDLDNSSFLSHASLSCSSQPLNSNGSLSYVSLPYSGNTCVGGGGGGEHRDPVPAELLLKSLRGGGAEGNSEMRGECNRAEVSAEQELRGRAWTGNGLSSGALSASDLSRRAEAGGGEEEDWEHLLQDLEDEDEEWSVPAARGPGGDAGEAREGGRKKRAREPPSPGDLCGVGEGSAGEMAGGAVEMHTDMDSKGAGEGNGDGRCGHADADQVLFARAHPASCCTALGVESLAQGACCADVLHGMHEEEGEGRGDARCGGGEAMAIRRTTGLGVDRKESMTMTQAADGASERHAEDEERTGATGGAACSGTAQLDSRVTPVSEGSKDMETAGLACMDDIAAGGEGGGGGHEGGDEGRRDGAVEEMSAQEWLASWDVPPSVCRAYSEAGVVDLYDWQIECLQTTTALEMGRNLVYSAPTGGGKTFVAEVIENR